jgi:hypothetical protein
VSPSSSTVDGLGPEFQLDLQPWSVNVLQLHLSASPSLARGSADGSAAAAAYLTAA